MIDSVMNINIIVFVMFIAKLIAFCQLGGGLNTESDPLFPYFELCFVLLK